MNRKLLPVVSVVATAICFEAIVRIGAPEPRRYLFPLSDMVLELPHLWRTGLAANVAHTVMHAVGGFIGAGLLGIVFGVLIGRSKTLWAMTRPVFDFARPLPSSALIPVIMALPLLGLRERSFFFIVIYGSVWPVLFGTVVGVAEVSLEAEGVARMMPWRAIDRLRWFVLPEAAPEIFAGLKIASAISFILAVTAEIQIGGRGLGGQLLQLQGASDVVGMWATILVIALVGWALNSLVGQCERRHPWLRVRDQVDDVDR